MFALSRVQAVIAVLLVLIVALALWMSQSTARDETIGGGLMTIADERRVENVTCEGACENLILVSDQQPDVRYYGADTLHACTTVNLWANTTSREGQITIGGYAFYDGYQHNLRTRTVEPEAIDGREIVYGIPKTASNIDDVWLFSLTLGDREDWNVLDTVATIDFAPTGLMITTDRNDTQATLLDLCADESKALNVYSLYHAADLTNDAALSLYSVNVTDRTLAAQSADGSPVLLFNEQYSNNTLVQARIPISVPVKDAVISFDLVTF